MDSDGDPRAGTFHQTRVTAGDTAYNMSGVYMGWLPPLRPGFGSRHGLKWESW